MGAEARLSLDPTYVPSWLSGVQQAGSPLCTSVYLSDGGIDSTKPTMVAVGNTDLS